MCAEEYYHMITSSTYTFLGPVSKWSLRQDLLLKLRNLELESLTCLSLSSKSCLKLHLETGPCTADVELSNLYRSSLVSKRGSDAFFPVPLTRRPGLP